MRTISAFTSLGIDPQLVAGMQRGVAALSEDRLPQIEETPDPYICRACGYVSWVRPAASCPTCGAWSSTFQHHKPVYWLDALDPYAALGKLRQTPIDVAALVDGLDESQLSSPAPDEGWSIRNIITHLFDAQRVLQFRINLMLEQENPLLKSLAVFDWATNEKERPALHPTRSWQTILPRPAPPCPAWNRSPSRIGGAWAATRSSARSPYASKPAISPCTRSSTCRPSPACGCCG